MLETKCVIKAQLGALKKFIKHQNCRHFRHASTNQKQISLLFLKNAPELFKPFKKPLKATSTSDFIGGDLQHLTATSFTEVALYARTIGYPKEKVEQDIRWLKYYRPREAIEDGIIAKEKVTLLIMVWKGSSSIYHVYAISSKLPAFPIFHKWDTKYSYLHQLLTEQKYGIIDKKITMCFLVYFPFNRWGGSPTPKKWVNLLQCAWE